MIISTDFSLNGLILENNNSGVVYSAIGVNGAKCSDFFKYPLFFEQLQAVEANLVIISLGTNESFDKLETMIFTAIKLQMIDNRTIIFSRNSFYNATTISISKKIPKYFCSKYTKALLNLPKKIIMQFGICLKIWADFIA